jgi:hypothetical protein
MEIGRRIQSPSTVDLLAAGSASPAASLAAALAAFDQEAAAFEREQQLYQRLQARHRPLLLQAGSGQRYPYPYGLFAGLGAFGPRIS